MSDTLASQGYPHTLTDQWRQSQQMGQIQSYGNDLNAPLYRQQLADGTWVQKGIDGRYHPYTEFQGMYDSSKGSYDENGNWKFNDKTMYNADGTAKVNSAKEGYGAISSAPSDSADPNKQFMTGQGFTLPEKEQQPEANRRRLRGPMPFMMEHPWGREPQAQYKEDIANVYDKENAQGQLTAQRYWQEANRDPRNEASKDAQTMANQKFTESQQQMNDSDNTSLVGRQLEEKDPDQYRQYAAQQIANARTAENDANAATVNAIEWRKRGSEDQYKYRQNALYNMQSNMLSMGPREEEAEKKKEQPAQQQQANESPEAVSYIDKVSHQDLLNCATIRYNDALIKAGRKDIASQVTPGGDWKEISRRDPGKTGLEHTLFKQPDLDVPEYHQAVEEMATKLWNGEPITVGGKQFNQNGEKGVAALLQLWEGRGGKKGWEEAQDKAKWGKATEASKQEQTTTPSQGFNMGRGANGNMNVGDMFAQGYNSQWNRTKQTNSSWNIQ